MKIFLLTFALLMSVQSISQSFEGILSYKVKFIFSDNVNSEIRTKTFDRLKKSGEYYDTLFITIKNGDYLKVDNAVNGKKTLYNAELNKLYFFTKQSNIVLTTNADIYAPPAVKLPHPQIVKNDSITIIEGYNCKSISLKWKGVGEEIYYFNESIIPIEPSLFKNHNYEYLNSIVEQTIAYPIKITKSLNKFMTINMTLININQTPINNNSLQIPTLKKASKRQSKMIEQFTGYDVMINKE